MINWYNSISHPAREKTNKFAFWVLSDSHSTNGPLQKGYLTQAITDANNEMTFDIALHGGDLFSRGAIGDAEGADLVSTLDLIGNGHTISDLYSIMGNHDEAFDQGTPNLFFQKYVDPAGNNPGISKIINANRPYSINPIGDLDHGTYYLEIGNMLIIMLGDRNDSTPPSGEYGQSGDMFLNGMRAGSLSTADWAAFKSLVENNTDKIIIVLAHHALFESTTRSGRYEFWDGNFETDYDHSVFADPIAESYAGCLSYINNTLAVDEIDTWLATNSQYIDLWMHGHCHRYVGQSWAGRTRKEAKFDTTVLNVCSTQAAPGEVLSNLINIEGNQLSCKTYVHDTAGGSAPVGWYAPEDFIITLKSTLSI